MLRKIVLSGYGNVGVKFVELLRDKKNEVKEKYGIELLLCGVLGSLGMIYEDKGIDIELLLRCGRGSRGIISYGEKSPGSFSKEAIFRGDVLVEATPSNIKNGQPAFSIITQAIKECMDIVSISKGALVNNLGEIMKMAEDRKVRVLYSGATAAALPTMDMGSYCLAGAEIKSIRGILNGTTNYILSKMKENNISFERALGEAIERGIAESNPHNDISGMDSACKILLLSNSLLGTRYSLSEINITGIENVTEHDIDKARLKGCDLRLIARADKQGDIVNVGVGVEEVYPADILFGVRGTNKGIVFTTDTMGEVAAIGGASNPLGAAAAALKDIINLYR